MDGQITQIEIEKLSCFVFQYLSCRFDGVALALSHLLTTTFFTPRLKNFSSSTLQAMGRRQQQGKLVAGSESQSQSSICSTPGQSSASNKISSDWPDPPDICNGTEDEAASIYSDSGEKEHQQQMEKM